VLFSQTKVVIVSIYGTFLLRTEKACGVEMKYDLKVDFSIDELESKEEI
jgi:hypothetical protein